MKKYIPQAFLHLLHNEHIHFHDHSYWVINSLQNDNDTESTAPYHLITPTGRECDPDLWNFLDSHMTSLITKYKPFLLAFISQLPMDWLDWHYNYPSIHIDSSRFVLLWTGFLSISSASFRWEPLATTLPGPSLVHHIPKHLLLSVDIQKVAQQAP